MLRGNYQQHFLSIQLTPKCMTKREFLLFSSFFHQRSCWLADACTILCRHHSQSIQEYHNKEDEIRQLEHDFRYFCVRLSRVPLNDNIMSEKLFHLWSRTSYVWLFRQTTLNWSFQNLSKVFYIFLFASDLHLLNFSHATEKKRKKFSSVRMNETQRLIIGFGKKMTSWWRMGP